MNSYEIGFRHLIFKYGERSLAHLIDLIQPFEIDAENRTQLLSN